MERAIKLLQSVLKRNNFELIEINENRFLIQQKQNSSYIVKGYLWFSIIITLIGIAAVIYASILLGIILLASIIPIYLRVANLNQQEQKAADKKLYIDASQIEIQQKENHIVIAVNDIFELNYEVDKDKNLSVGMVTISTEDERYVELIEIFGQDESYLEEDIKVIAQTITKILNQ